MAHNGVVVSLYGPVATMPLIVTVVVPVFVNVAICGTLLVPTATVGNVNNTGVNVTVPCCVPVPTSETVCGLLGAPLVMVNVAVRVPTTVGVNVTLMSQVAPAASEVPQMSV